MTRVKMSGTLAIVVAAVALSACAKKPNSANLPEQTIGATAATPGSKQDFVVNVGDRVFFETDQTSLTAEGRATLNQQAQWLKQYGNYAFTVEGHADERGTRDYNLSLGARRATSVKNYLIAQGVAANRIKTISFGKERPVAVCDDISCWSQNRRAVTILQGANS